MPGMLNEDERRQGLAALPEWRETAGGGAIGRTFRFANFGEAFAFMTRVALEAEKLDHHPDWSNSYNVVEIRLTTHDQGGVTAGDLELARRIDAVRG